MKIQKFVFNPFMENSYLLYDEISGEAAIVDPGCSNHDEESVITEFIQNNKLTPKYLINTHCHIDHILGNNFIKNRYNLEFLIPEDDEFLFEVQYNNSFGLRTEQLKFPKPDKYMTEDLQLKLGSNELKLISTPGHTPGEFCIYMPVISSCITGDVLFYEGVGRTDLWGGDYSVLMASIKNKLLTLPEETIIYPGHGQESTIGYEKIHNPFLSER